MSDWLVLLLLALGVYRAAHMVVFEDGPFEVFTEIRSAAASRLGSRHWVTKGLNCPLCTSFWISLPAAVLGALLLPLPGLFWGLLWFGLAGGVLVLHSAKEALERSGQR